MNAPLGHYPALFLDRDGVMIEESNYLRDPEGVRLLGGIPNLIRAAKALGMVVIEVTNQAGIAHGYLEWLDFVKVEHRLMEVLAEEGVSVDAAFACPFHPQGRAPYRQANHYWRKPNPGMLLEAQDLLNVELGSSALIGDK